MRSWLGLPPSAYEYLNSEGVRSACPPDRALELWACMALANTPGLGCVSCKTLYAEFGSASAAVESLRAWPDIGIRKHVVHEFQKKSWADKALNEWCAAAHYMCRFLLIGDAEYPERLRTLPDAPLVLFYEGNLDFLQVPALAVVGARKCDPDGILACRTLCRELSDSGVCVVSGLALGIDTEAHNAALNGLGGTIAVMGTGLDATYPLQNSALRSKIAERGLIITEYAPQSRLRPQNFPQRNRIMMGISLGVLVVEASLKSGSLITARFAAENGRAVYAVPGRFGSPLSAGCAQLIRNGAIPVFDAVDILWDLKSQLQAVQWPLTKKEEPPEVAVENVLGGSSVEARIVAFLREHGPIHIDCIGSRLGLEVSEVSSTLIMLEMSGMVRCFPGMIYGVNA